MRVVFDERGCYAVQQPSAVALGTFDGVHLGHRELIRQLKICKESNGFNSIVYTFTGHPLQKLAPEKVPPLILLLREKIKACATLHVDMLSLNAFNERFYHQPPEDFIQNLVLQYHVKCLVVGYDFKFGYKGSGNTALLNVMAQKLGFELVIVDPVLYEGEVVSSSRIRNLIHQGHMQQAAACLGSHYSLGGHVIHGYGRGKGIGFPTANLDFPHQKVMPKSGVYLTECRTGGRHYLGLTSIGCNPTFASEGIHVETYMPDFIGSLYGQYLRLFFLERLRDEIKFSNAENLTEQIRQDVSIAKKRIYKYL